MNTSVPPAARHQMIVEILKLDDAAFVMEAYSAILDRDPDPGGLANYVSQIRAGVEKMQILAELAFSTEGRSKAADGPRDRELIDAYLHRTTSLRHKLLQMLRGKSIDAAMRQVRILSNRVYLLEQSLAQQSALLAELLKAVSREPAIPPDGGTTKHEVWQSTRSEGSRSCSTFAEIKRAIAAKQHE